MKPLVQGCSNGSIPSLIARVIQYLRWKHVGAAGFGNAHGLPLGERSFGSPAVPERQRKTAVAGKSKS